MTRGLNAAHKLRIIHRDLKADNILLTFSDDVGATLVVAPGRPQGPPLHPCHGKKEGSPVKLVMVFLVLLLFTPSAQITTKPEALRVPAFTAFAEPDPEGLEFSEQNGVTGWNNDRINIVWYGEIKTAGRLGVAISIRLPEKTTSKLQLRVAGQSLVATVRGEGAKPVTVPFGSFQIPSPGYHSFTLTGLFKEGVTFGDVDALVLDGPARKDSHFSLLAERGAPSVHLAFPIPEGTQATWSYYEACGFSRGYFGIQVNSPTERRIIFSV